MSLSTCSRHTHATRCCFRCLMMQKIISIADQLFQPRVTQQETIIPESVLYSALGSCIAGYFWTEREKGGKQSLDECCCLWHRPYFIWIVCWAALPTGLVYLPRMDLMLLHISFYLLLIPLSSWQRQIRVSSIPLEIKLQLSHEKPAVKIFFQHFTRFNWDPPMEEMHLVHNKGRTHWCCRIKNENTVRWSVFLRPLCDLVSWH